MKTKFSSYCVNGVSDGCRLCVKGKKIVLFITGICKRNCWYCSLSRKRKNKDITWANERICKNVKDAIEEATESNANSAGITGGDPFVKLDRTIKYAKALKKRFGKRFHIHVYLPTKFLTTSKLERLSKCIDEVRFHPEFLSKKLTEKEMIEDIEKIKFADKYWKKKDIGIELPMIPNRKEDILEFILRVNEFIGFVNLNEFEISDTNFNLITKDYKMNSGGYTIKDSIKAGIWILDKMKKLNLKLKVHLCTAETKNNYQFRNRLKNHKILPYGKRTNDGNVMYFAVYAKNKEEYSRLKKQIKGYADNKKQRIIISESLANKLPDTYQITKVEEFPTFDRIEIEKEIV